MITLIKIGDFARLTGVSIRSLRHYDQLGLFKPAEVNDVSGHRYYTLDQLPRLNRIAALKNLGLSLKQIIHLLEANLSADEIRGMLLLRRAELEEQIEEQERCLNEVESSLHKIEREGRLADYAIVVKQINPLPIVSMRPLQDGQKSEYPEIDDPIQRAFFDLYDKARAHNISVQDAIGLYHDPPLLNRQLTAKMPHAVSKDNFECGFILADNMHQSFAHDELKVYNLPAVKMVATVLFKGALNQRGEGSLALYEWAGRNGYSFTGPIREIYLRVVNDNLADTENLVEMQFPVAL